MGLITPKPAPAIMASSPPGPPLAPAAPTERALLWRRTARYLTAAETHTYAFSIAGQAMLSFFPFVVFLLSLTRNVFHAPRLYRGMLTLVGAYLPVSDSALDRTRSFILDNLSAIVEHHQRAQVLSLLILLATCTGIFLPLEVALNRVWNVAKNRSYASNWAVAFALAVACGVLGMLSASFTALSESYSTRLARFLWKNSPLHLGALHELVRNVSIILVRAGAIPLTIAVFFLIYWKLPNRRLAARQVMPAAIAAGLAWEISKYAYIALLPSLNFREIYGPFAISVSLVLWAYVSALLLLLGAELMAEGPRIAAERAARNQSAADA